MKRTTHPLAPLFVLVLTAAVASAVPATRWAFQTDGPIRGSVALDDDTVYFGSSDGLLRAVDKRNGSLKWSFDTGAPIAGAPALAGKFIIVAGRSTTVRALNKSDGSLKWTFEMGETLPTPTSWNYFTAPPVVDGEQVLVGSGDGNLYALETADGALRWKFATGDSIRAAPLVDGKNVYLASGDDYVYSLSADDGSLQWKFATDGVKFDLSQGFIRSDIFSQPVLRNGLLMVASRDSKVYAIDVATHEKRWDFTYDSTWAMSAAADDQNVYVGWSTNNHVSALDIATGAKRWDYVAGSHTYTTGLLLGDRVYWGCADGKLYGFNRASGALEWSYTVGPEVYSSLVEEAGTFYFGTDDGRLLAVAIDAPPHHKAVYLPHYPGQLADFEIDPAIAPYLVKHGYAKLTSPVSLARWLTERSGERDEPSVVVFAYAQIPVNVVGEDPSKGTLRTYLESGGKVVWPWGMPDKYTFDDHGKFNAYNPDLGSRLLSVGFLGFEDGGNYFARATQEGRNWGMPAWLKTTFASLKPEADVVPLAIDEYGRPGAWVRKFNLRPGSGWVNFDPKGFGATITEEQLAMFERVASYSID